MKEVTQYFMDRREGVIEDREPVRLAKFLHESTYWDDRPNDGNNQTNVTGYLSTPISMKFNKSYGISLQGKPRVAASCLRIC